MCVYLLAAVVCCCHHLFWCLQISGTENAEFVAFSGKALKSAQARLKSFLALLPSDQLQAAQQQVDSQQFM